MVQIIDENAGGFLNAIGGGVSRGLGSAAQSLPEILKLKKEQQKQDLINKLIGKGGGNKQSSPADQLAGKKGQPGQGNPQQDQGGEGFSSKNLNDSDLLGLSLLGDPQSARLLQNIQDVHLREEREEKKEKREVETAERKKFEADREFHSKRSGPIIDEALDIMKSASVKKGLSAQLRRDIESGNTEGIIPYMVEKTGLEFWRNPESARFRTAAKERFRESLNSIAGGARPNVYLEQQLMSAQPTLGRDKESNATVLDMEEFIDDVKEERAKAILDIAKQDREKLGYERNDIAERAEEKVANYAEDRQDQMAYTIRQRKEDNMSNDQMINEIVMKNVSEGTPLTLRMAELLMIKNNDDPLKAQREAKSLGFVIPKESTYKRYIQ